MNALQTILIIIIALAGYPVGLLIAWLAEDELKQGKKWFKIIILISAVALTVSFIFAQGETLLFLACSFAFIALVALASLIKSRKARKRRK